MKILHILSANERNGYNLFKQMQEKCDLENHTFFVLTHKNIVEKHFQKYLEFDNFIFNDGKNVVLKLLNFYRMLRKADYVVLHSLIFTTNRYVYFLNFLKRFHKKFIWIEWGADLYNWKRPNDNLKNILLNKANYNLRKNITKVGVTFENDIEELKKQFGDKQVFSTPLPFGTDRYELLKETTELTKRKDNEIRIQVAHNALPFNNHISILEKLENYKQENVKIIMPLSYGTFGINGLYRGVEYKNNLINCSKQMFPNKIIIMEKNIDMKHYLQYLWNIDIAVFDTARPIGLANIYYLYFLGKKIFLPKDSMHYKFFIKNNMKIFATEDVPNMTFEQFISNDLVPYTLREKDDEDLDIIRKRFEPYEDIKRWSELFDSLKKEYEMKKVIK